ncbi:MAG: MFS transporter [Magnetovibrio sp.]|nr:MFS transporter [Magnetovibrio sp.]
MTGEIRKKIDFAFLNAGHFFDHFLILIFATVAMVIATDREVVISGVSNEWNMSYAQLIPFSIAGFIAFGLCSLPAAWIADRWSRPGMIAVFFIGMGTATIISAFSTSPLQLGVGICLIGVFGAIYHPVGIAMVVQGRKKTGIPIAMNGVFGNLGVAAAPLATLLVVEHWGWRVAFLLPGILCVLTGLAYLAFLKASQNQLNSNDTAVSERNDDNILKLERGILIRIFSIIFFTAAIGSFIFQSTTFALPKIFDERLTGLATSGKEVGWWAFMVFSIASVAQLIVGYLVDRHAVRWVFAIVAFCQMIFSIVLANLTGVPALLFCIAFMLVVFGQIPINDVLIGRIARSEWRSRAYSFRYIISFAVMATTVPAISVLHGNWGFYALFAIMAILAGLIFCAVLFLPAIGLSAGGKQGS